MQLQVTAIFQQVPEGWIGWAQEIAGAMTQGDTLEDARANLAEAVQLASRRTARWMMRHTPGFR